MKTDKLADFRKKAQDQADVLERDYGLADSASKLLLESFVAIYATELACQASIEEYGMLVPDRFKQPKDHPLLKSLRDARAQKLMVLKALGLDFAEVNTNGPGRPPRGY